LVAQILTAGKRGIHSAAQAIGYGEIVAFPTETVYGLGADVLNREALLKIFKAKGRPADNPLIAHVNSYDMVQRLVQNIPADAVRLMEAFWPGPLTLVMQKRPEVPYEMTAGLDTIAVRMPAHPVALALIEACGQPIAAPSANRSGLPSPTTAQDVFSDLGDEIPYIIDGGPCSVGIESTVLDMTSLRPLILRPGIITIEMIRNCIRSVSNYEYHPQSDEPVKSPGVKYRHYAPKAKLVIVSGSEGGVTRKILDLVSKDIDRGLRPVILCYEESRRHYGADSIVLGSKYRPETVARNLYWALREVDRRGMDTAYAEALSQKGAGAAVMNRMLRAAGGHIEEA